MLLFYAFIVLGAIMPLSSAKVAIVLTTHRSGSSFIVQTIDQFGPHIHNSGEILIDDLFHTEKDFDNYLATWSEKQPAESEVIGFKVMYSQITRGNPDWFKNYVVNNQATVIHLVREAFIMSVASAELSKVKSSDGKSHFAKPVPQNVNFSSTIHVSSKEIAAAASIEAKAMSWKTWCRTEPRVDYHYFAYEDFIGPKKKQYVERLFSAVTGRMMTVAEVQNVTQSSYVVIHEPTCSTRISNFQEIKSKLSPRTIEACAVLDSFANRDD